MIRSVFIFFVIAVALACKKSVRPVFAPQYLYHETGLKVITSVINNRDSTIATIYGNDLALEFSKNIHSGHQIGERYVMVTSVLKPMPHWYGTNMNGGILSVEHVTAITDDRGGVVFDYKIQTVIPATVADKKEANVSRAEFIASQPAAVFP